MVEKRKVNLRSSVPTAGTDAPPQLREINLPGMRGQLPLAPGVVGGSLTDLSPENRSKAQALLSEGGQRPPAIKPPAPVQFEHLPPQKQEEVLKAVAQAGVASKPQKIPPPQRVSGIVQPTHPSIVEAKRMADQADMEPEVERFQEQAEPPSVAAQQHYRQAPPTDPGYTDMPPTGGLGAKPFLCKHCGWAVDKDDAIKPSRKDKQAFVMSVLGRTRFVKTYDLLDGSFRVSFRTLTTEENDAVMQQLLADYEANTISTPQAVVVEATRYQMALGLATIISQVGEVTVPTFDEYDADKPARGTILPHIVKYVNTQIIQHEPLRKILIKAYGHFLDTVNKLEVSAETPDFWSATED